MGRRKRLINDTNIPQHEIEKLARCFLPDILAYYESEEGQREGNVKDYAQNWSAVSGR